MKYDDMTEDQKKCFSVLVKTFRGEHHVPKVKAFGRGIKVNVLDGLSSYDSDYLTRLIVFAHDLCCRVEIIQSGPGRLGIVLHKREPFGEINERHPVLEDHIKLIRGIN